MYGGRMINWLKRVSVIVSIALLAASPVVAAQNEQGNFSLQVTPSPLVLTVKPGESTDTELKIRNNGDKAEHLKIELKNFNVNGKTGNITLNDTPPTDISQWVTFANPTFDILAGEWFSEHINITLPKDAGFSYSFALVISRVNDLTPKTGTSTVKGSVAVFTLISVDRPGAKRELQLTEFKPTQKIYEFLPASLTTTIKNTGNTIAQPYGNIFIQRSAKSQKPLSVLPVNEGHGYILPGSSRTLTTDWSDGFPVYVNSKEAVNSETKKGLSWNWDKLSQLRIGRYSAKLVAVYNDGHSDVPIVAQTTFWVIPWKFLLGFGLILLLLFVGIFTLVKKFVKVIKRPKSKQKQDEKQDN